MQKPVIILNETTFLPTEIQRRQIFYLLKQVSSVTAWRRILGYYRRWADVTAQCVRVAEENGWQDDTSLPRSEHALILKCVAHCQAGVDRLARGDKRVFKFDKHGQFAMAGRMLSHWSQMMERYRIGENARGKHTPLWAEFCEAHTTLAYAWGECGPFILEPRYLEDPALMFYGEWIDRYLEAQFYPDVLPEVPAPANSALVRTGSYVPCSGIWEPVDAPAPSLWRWLTRAPRPAPPFRRQGTMSYLHGGSPAPTATITTARDSIDIETTWRLLWKDERYADGSVPEEENGYRFTHPEPIVPSSPILPGYRGPIWAASGVIAPAGGRWLLGWDMRTAVMVHEGDPLPRHHDLDVHWVLLPGARFELMSSTTPMSSAR
ncbi:Imm71 family immunity protein [[Empedobacter] haloabium]|uniref:Imm71 family immunity protein n=1 Tax=[Empedobacter] haloabium TaxID=592317 RepID=A0ABZ1UT64_9BURK